MQAVLMVRLNEKSSGSSHFLGEQSLVLCSHPSDLNPSMTFSDTSVLP